MTTMRRFEPTGPLALAPSAFGLMIMESPDASIAPRMVGNVAVVPVRGPLMQHMGWCASYEAIRACVTEALSLNPDAVLLDVESPGGLVAGCFETAIGIRAACEAAGVPLHAYVNGQATSAAYALVSVAERITVPSTGVVGSIGVLEGIVDETARDSAMGIRYTLIGSGARKTDTQSHTPLTEAAVQAMQARVDGMAQVFFEHVSVFRPQLSVEALAAMEAAMVFGQQAVTAGLADALGTFDDAVATAAGAKMAALQPPPTEEKVMTTSAYQEAVAALRTAAEGDGEEAAAAKKMLATMEEEKPEEDKSAAEEDAPPPEKKDDEEEPAASSASASVEARLLAIEKRTLLATRPDLSAEMRTAISAPDVTLAAAERIVASIPRTPRQAAQVAAPTRGAGQVGGRVLAFGDRTIEPNAELDRVMGLSKQTDAPIKRTATSTTFGTITRDQANEILKKNGGAL